MPFHSRDEFDKGQKLGEGGFGNAYLVHPLNNPSDVYILKEVSLTKMRNDNQPIDEWQQKHQKMVQFNHPYIVRVFGSFEGKYQGEDALLTDHDMYYFVMEYCSGGDLAELIEKAVGPIPEAQIQAWCGQLISAVKFLHDAGHIHRDIKPQNIFLTGENGQQTVKLGDFGLVKSCDRQRVGTLVYWPPECFKGEQFDKPGDAWSLGVTFYELANFTRPFKGEDEIKSQAPQPFSSNRGYSTEIRDFIMEIINEKDPDERLTIDQLLEHRFLNSVTTQMFLENKKRKPTAAELPHLKAQAKEMLSSYAGRVHKAAINGNSQEIKSIFQEFPQNLPADLQSEANCYCKMLVEHQNADHVLKGTALLEATWKGQLEIVKFLVEELQADLEARQGDEKFQSMAIHLAAEFGHCEIVRYLLSKRPDFVDAKDKLNNTPLCKAAQNGHLAIVELLAIWKKANVEAKGELGRTPLHWAALEGQLKVVKLLVENAKANIQAKDSYADWLPIHLAAYFGHVEVVRYLTQRRKDLVNAKDRFGKTPLDYAIKNNKSDVVALLK